MPTPTAKPVINVVQSVLGYLQWQAFEFLPSAINFPTLWHCSGLPPGLFFEAETGAIFGAAILPGVYTFVLYAENVVGLSDPQSFTLGIEASGYNTPASVLELTIDSVTRRVTLSGVLQDQASGAEAESEALFWAKAGDDLILNVRFTKGGVQFDAKLTGLKMTLKEFEPDEPVLSAGEAMVKTGSGETASFRIYLRVEDEALRAALSNYEADGGTQFLALAEFEWTQENETGVGPEEIRGSSRTFGVMLVRDLTANPTT